MEQLNPTEWKEKSDSTADAVIIDVRTEAEQEQGMIKGALQSNIFEQAKFMDFVETLDKDKSYFIYCRSGARSANACSYLESEGFTKTFNLDGGILGWPFEVEK